MNALLIALGALTMIVELTIPRLIAPAYGNTLFSWTAIIAVVLSAMTLGYFIGGKLAERTKTLWQWIVFLSFLSAIWVIGIGLGGQWTVDQLSFLNILIGPLVTSAVFAGTPTLLNALAIPLIIQSRKETAGAASGNCFAISTIGSIIGVLVTGYILLPFLGIRGSLFFGSSIVFIALLINCRFILGLTGLVIIILALFMPSPSIPNLLYDHNNGYHRIKILTDQNNPEIRSLYLDNTLEGAVQLGMTDPVAGYQNDMKIIFSTLNKPGAVLVIGGGAFTLPRNIKHLYPESHVDVIELDPEVVAAARQFLELDDTVNTIVGDGRQVLKMQHKRYDLIFNDAFKGYKNIPFHLTTREFNQVVKTRLSADGVYVVNVRGDPSKSDLAASLVQTLQKTFDHVSILSPNSGNTLVSASMKPLMFGQKAGSYDQGMFLTDNQAPTELLIVLGLIKNKLGY